MCSKSLSEYRIRIYGANVKRETVPDCGASVGEGPFSKSLPVCGWHTKREAVRRWAKLTRGCLFMQQFWQIPCTTSERQQRHRAETLCWTLHDTRSQWTEQRTGVMWCCLQHRTTSLAAVYQQDSLEFINKILWSLSTRFSGVYQRDSLEFINEILGCSCKQGVTLVQLWENKSRNQRFGRITAKVLTSGSNVT